MRWGTLVVTLAACGRVGFDAGADAEVSVDAAADPSRLVWLPFDDDPADGADNRGTASTTASCIGTCPTLGLGKRGGAYVFGGGGLRLPRPSELALASGTVMAWARVDVPLADGDIYSLAGIPFGAEAKNSWEVYLHRSAASGLTLTAGGDANIVFYVEKPWTSPNGTWVHVALVWDTGGIQRLVLDGVTVGEGTSLEGVYDAHDLVVGADEDAGLLVHAWGGAIDDFLVIDRALTNAAILALSQGIGL